MREARPQHQFIRTLLPMACDGVGPSETCLNIAKGAHLAGYPIEVFANRTKLPKPVFPMKTTLPGVLSQIPYKLIKGISSRATEENFLKRIEKNDVAYVWPAASVRAHKILYERGIPIVLEGINTRMSRAKPILDQAYRDLGLSPAHSITNQRIEEEEEKLGYATAIFAPNPLVESALSDLSEKINIIPSSYGVDTGKYSGERKYEEKENLTFVFCGYGCIRKGIHFLLEAWKKMPQEYTLKIVGNVEPIVKEIYSDVLDLDNVHETGFVKNVHHYFSTSDIFVFPSLEEGGPQVTYEAALHGLPIIATTAGASRLGDIEETMYIVKNLTGDNLFQALQEMASSSSLRKKLGENARRNVKFFDWNCVGARRAQEIIKT